MMGAYLVIQALDGNVLVPLLFSGAVDPHPIAIIVAVLVMIEDSNAESRHEDGASPVGH